MPGELKALVKFKESLFHLYSLFLSIHAYSLVAGVSVIQRFPIVNTILL